MLKMSRCFVEFPDQLARAILMGEADKLHVRRAAAELTRLSIARAFDKLLGHETLSHKTNLTSSFSAARFLNEDAKAVVVEFVRMCIDHGFQVSKTINAASNSRGISQAKEEERVHNETMDTIVSMQIVKQLAVTICEIAAKSALDQLVFSTRMSSEHHARRATSSKQSGDRSESPELSCADTWAPKTLLDEGKCTSGEVAVPEGLLVQANSSYLEVDELRLSTQQRSTINNVTHSFVSKLFNDALVHVHAEIPAPQVSQSSSIALPAASSDDVKTSHEFTKRHPRRKRQEHHETMATPLENHRCSPALPAVKPSKGSHSNSKQLTHTHTVDKHNDPIANLSLANSIVAKLDATIVRPRGLETDPLLSPIDRAKRTYRPRRQLRSQGHVCDERLTRPKDEMRVHNDAGDEDGEHSDSQAHSTSPAKHPRSLEPLHSLAPPSTQLSTAKSNVYMIVVDRPDRIGLTSKPKKRSGFCQQCIYEGRPCKISDCLRHQVLK